jgi:hypothetical protein
MMYVHRLGPWSIWRSAFVIALSRHITYAYRHCIAMTQGTDVQCCLIASVSIKKARPLDISLSRGLAHFTVRERPLDVAPLAFQFNLLPRPERT